jgi:hypothetical protein
VNGVEYKCCGDTAKVAEALGMSDCSDETVSLLAFRNIIEANGERYALRRITSFCDCNMSIISIPNNVENIGSKCFYECSSLCDVVIESDSELKEIGAHSFSRSAVKTIRIPRNVERIGKRCFLQCKSLCEIVFESDSKLKEIVDSAFSNSGIKSVEIPSNVQKIGKKCFIECESLCEVVFESDSKLRKIDDCAFCGS